MKSVKVLQLKEKLLVKEIEIQTINLQSKFEAMVPQLFFEGLLLILQLREFLNPEQICFLVDIDDQSWSQLEYFGNNYVCAATCERSAVISMIALVLN